VKSGNMRTVTRESSWRLFMSYCSLIMLPIALMAMNSVSQVCDSDNLFYAGAQYAIDKSVVEFEVGDFDGDGDLDILLLAENGIGEIVAFFNQGDGTFVSGGVVMDANSIAYSITSGDLDGDGDLDIVFTGGGYDTVEVYSNNGAASFGFGGRYGKVWTDDPRGVVLGDLDSDGDLDMAVVYQNSADVGVYLNNGDGSFDSGMRFGDGIGFSDIQLADIDGDGDSDLAIANRDAQEVCLLMNSGDGTFLTQVNYYMPEIRPDNLVFGDLNSDGDLEMIVNTRVFENQGDGSYVLTDIDLGFSGGSSVALGDLDFDDDLDIVTAANAEIFLNIDDGEFDSSASYAAYCQQVELCDLDGDGDLDFVLRTSGRADFVVIKGNGDGTAQASVRYPAGLRPSSVSLADLNSDGHLDMAVSNWYTDDVSVLMGTGDGEFASDMRYTVGDLPKSIVMADFNNDKNIDIVAANYLGNDASVLMSNGDGSFAAEVRYQLGIRPLDLAAGDLDGDGFQDVVVVNNDSNDISILFNIGDGTFSPQVNLEIGGGPRSVVIADINGDGYQDIAVARSSLDDIGVLLNSGIGKFGSAIFYSVGDRPWVIDSADMDNDGDKDLVVLNRNSSDISVLKNIGNGVFLDQISLALECAPESFAIGDLDSDGNMDLSIVNLCDTNLVCINDGSGDSFSNSEYYISTSLTGVAMGDIDEDGDLDLAIAADALVVCINHCGSNQSCIADLDGNTHLNFLDISTYLLLYQSSDGRADFDGNGSLNFLDVSAFLAAFSSGCP